MFRLLQLGTAQLRLLQVVLGWRTLSEEWRPVYNLLEFLGTLVSVYLGCLLQSQGLVLALQVVQGLGLEREPQRGLGFRYPLNHARCGGDSEMIRMIFQMGGGGNSHLGTGICNEGNFIVGNYSLWLHKCLLSIYTSYYHLNTFVHIHNALSFGSPPITSQHECCQCMEAGRLHQKDLAGSRPLSEGSMDQG